MMENQLHKMLYSLGSGQYTKPIGSDLRAVSSVGKQVTFNHGSQFQILCRSHFSR